MVESSESLEHGMINLSNVNKNEAMKSSILHCSIILQPEV